MNRVCADDMYLALRVSVVVDVQIVNPIQHVLAPLAVAFPRASRILALDAALSTLAVAPRIRAHVLHLVRVGFVSLAGVELRVEPSWKRVSDEAVEGWSAGGPETDVGFDDGDHEADVVVAVGEVWLPAVVVDDEADAGHGCCSAF